MSKRTVLTAVIVVAVSSAVLVSLYRVHTRTPYTMAWDMAAHTYYGAEIGQDIRLFQPLSFLRHVNDSSIALWPFLHPLLLGISFSIFGFSEGTAVILSLAFSLLTIVAAFWVCWIATGRKSVVPGLLVPFLLLSSPLYLEFSTCVMLEIFGAFFTILTVGLLAGSRESTSRSSGVPAAIALLCLFLTKINYGLYLFVPYLIGEALSLTPERRRDYSSLFMRFLDLRNPKSVINMLIILDIAAIIVMVSSGGFSFSLAQRDVELSGTSNLVYLLLVLLLLKGTVFWTGHRRELHESLLPTHLGMVRVVVFPLLVWFFINPGRISELIRMSSDRSSGLPFLGLYNLVYYPMSILTGYTCHFGVGIAILCLVFTSAAMWRRNPPVVRLLLIYAAFGYVGLTLQIRHFAEPRFFFVQAVAVMVIAGYTVREAVSLFARKAQWWRIAYFSAVSLAVILTGLFPLRAVYTVRLGDIISDTVPTGDRRLDDMVRTTMAQIGNEERTIAILGGCNEISPYLVKWHLIRENSCRILREVSPPVKSIEDSSGVERLLSWLRTREADAIIAIAVSEASPFARSADFELRHASKQGVVEELEQQTVYRKTSEERWRSRAVEVRLYIPEPKQPE